MTHPSRRGFTLVEMLVVLVLLSLIMLAVVSALRGVAHACIDVSDGLLADLGHVCARSGVAAEIDIDAVPASPALQRFAPAIQRLIVCGGGVRNGTLMRQLEAALPSVQVLSSQALGVDPQTVEASAFAWLGLHTLQRLPLDMQAITGARGARVLGCLYPA